MIRPVGRAFAGQAWKCPADAVRRSLHPVHHSFLLRSQGLRISLQCMLGLKDPLTPENANQNPDVFPVKLIFTPRFTYLDTTSSLVDRVGNLVKNLTGAGPLSVIERAFPSELREHIGQVIPRYSEGGAFVKLSHSGTDKEGLSKLLRTHLEKNPVTPWFSPFRSVRAAVVRGRPWLEDLQRFPSSRVKVEFLPTSPGTSPVELTPELLYSLTRRYGKLSDITPQPSDSKVQPRYALLDFSRPSYAIMTKNCLHGYTVSEAEGGGSAGTLLKFSYQQKIKPHLIRDWIVNHPRIVIPIVAALLATITVIIFDPIRTFFIKVRISPPIDVHDSRIWKWIQQQASRANDMFSFHQRQRSDSDSLKAIWQDRRDDIQQLQNWLIEATNTFTVVQGPRGSGKKELVLGEALKDYRHKLVIDCKPIQEARGDSATINATAAEVGYRPVFSWMNSISSLIDVATQTLGANAGLSETLDSQLGHILQNTANALKKIALEKKKKGSPDAHMTDDEFLEAHPECRPVVVIDNFLHKANDNQMIYDKLSDWAAALTVANIARVIFLTGDISYSKTLSRALPNQVFHEMQLGDCTPQVAKQFVLDHLHIDHTPNNNDTEASPQTVEGSSMGDLEKCIETLGGRLSDLEFFARMISRGKSPKDAVNDIIDQSAAEILKMYITDVDSSGRLWTSEQAWHLIRNLAEAQDGSILYSQVLFSGMFKKDGENTIRALEQAELISVTTLNGRPSTIKPGRPVYAAAFKRLVDDDVLRCRLGLRTLGEQIAMETANINKYEGELQVLGSLEKEPKEIRPRVRWLLANLAGSQANIEKYEQESAGLKQILQSKV
ncbi:mitochondrial escape protein 2 [Emydomyces testavorans]|uniref:Mitochondrial escape protein 2 n=1 Tax=Emydomyces testavorans TaxID=2070801 RepID=A0AAF0DRT0_9EURO|nr:mitochondrial escape protein 2 [Emydomyces testavorans]